MRPRINRSRLVGVVAGVAMSALLVACGSSGGGSGTGAAPTSGGTSSGGGGSLTSITIAGPVSAATLPVIVAQQEGFFKKNGLDSTFTTVLPATLPQIVGKQYDIGLGIQPVFVSALNAGVPVKAFSGGLLDTPSNPQTAIVTKKVTSIKGLAGTTVGVGALVGNIALATKAFLEANGVDPNSVKFLAVQNADVQAQLDAGNIDAAVVTQPFGTAAIQKGYHNLGDPFTGDLAGLTGFWFSSDSWVSSHSQVISGFRKALSQTYDFMKQHPDQAKVIYAKFSGLSADLINAAKMPDYQVPMNIAALAPWPGLLTKYAGLKPTDKIANLNNAILSGTD